MADRSASRAGIREGCCFHHTDESPSFWKKTKVTGDSVVVIDDPHFRGHGSFSRIAEDATPPVEMSQQMSSGATGVWHIKERYGTVEGGRFNYKIGVDFSEPPEPFVYHDNVERNYGELAYQSGRGARVEINDVVALSAAESYIKVYTNPGEVHLRATGKLDVTEAGYEMSGVVVRDKRDGDLGEFDGQLIDHKLGDLSRYYEAIGRNPERFVMKIATPGFGVLPELHRNPPFTERAQVFYEFPDNYDIGTETEEQEYLTTTYNNWTDLDGATEEINPEGRYKLRNPNFRTSKRYNLFNFDDRNKLVERVIGTAVDFYGNVIDVNRQKVDVGFDDHLTDSGINNKAIIEMNRKHRRGVMYHLEFNSRKENEEQDTINKFIYKDRSKWSFDVDKEGLTKINIPASSKFGNVPILTRYEANPVYTKEVDITIENSQFGIGDTSSSPAMLYELSTNITDRLSGKPLLVTINDDNLIGITQKSGAYHNIVTTAMRLMGDFSYNTKKGTASYDLFPATNVTLDRGYQGGQSVSTNLDGSLELYVGADEIDKKSFVLDTAGSVIQRIGRDLSGRSVMTQADGDVFLQVGGVGPRDSSGEDERFSSDPTVGEFRPGSFMVQVVTQNSSAKRPALVPSNITNAGSSVPLDQVIRMTEDGLEITLDGKLVLDISGDIELVSGANLNIRAPQIYVQPGHAGQGKGSPPRMIMPKNGIPIGGP